MQFFRLPVWRSNHYAITRPETDDTRRGQWPMQMSGHKRKFRMWSETSKCIISWVRLNSVQKIVCKIYQCQKSLYGSLTSTEKISSDHELPTGMCPVYWVHSPRTTCGSGCGGGGQKGLKQISSDHDLPIGMCQLSHMQSAWLLPQHYSSGIYLIPVKHTNDKSANNPATYSPSKKTLIETFRVKIVFDVYRAISRRRFSNNA